MCYGLALQGLGKGGLRTNLLPKEIVHDRLIREKKPWAVAAAAVLLLAAGVSFTSFALQLSTADEGLWQGAEQGATQVVAKSKKLKADADEAISRFKKTEEIGKHLVSNVAGRTQWLDLLSKLDACLPQEKRPVPQDAAGWSEWEQLQVTSIDCQHVDDLAQWFAAIKMYPRPGGESTAAATATNPPGGPPATPAGPAAVPAPLAPSPSPAASGVPAAGGDVGPTGPGTVVQIMGHHYHNTGNIRGPEFVLRTLLAKLASPEMVQLGVSWPVLVRPSPDVTVEFQKHESVTASTVARGRRSVVWAGRDWAPRPPRSPKRRSFCRKRIFGCSSCGSRAGLPLLPPSRPVPPVRRR